LPLPLEEAVPDAAAAAAAVAVASFARALSSADCFEDEDEEDEEDEEEEVLVKDSLLFGAETALFAEEALWGIFSLAIVLLFEATACFSFAGRLLFSSLLDTARPI
jgi:hypothetical protein